MIRYHAQWVVPVCSPPIRDGVVAVDGIAIAYVGIRRRRARRQRRRPRRRRAAARARQRAHATSSSPRCAAFSRISTFAAGFCVSRTRAAPCSIATRCSIRRATESRKEFAPASRRTPTRATSGVVDASDARSRRARHHVPGSVRSRSGAVRGVDRGSAREGRRLRYLETPLVRVGVSPHAPYTVSDDLFRATTGARARAALPMAMHIAESELEQRARRRRERVVRRRTAPARHSPSRPRADRRSSCSTRSACSTRTPLLIHCVRVDAARHRVDRATRGRASRIVRRRTRSSVTASRRSTRCSAAGIAVGLGSPIRWRATIAWTCSTKRASRCSRSARGSARSRRPKRIDVLELATIGGARAIGLDCDRSGRSRPGKQADLAAFPLDGVGPDSRSRRRRRSSALAGARARSSPSPGSRSCATDALVSPRAGLARSNADRWRDALAEWLATGAKCRRRRRAIDRFRILSLS